MVFDTRACRLFVDHRRMFLHRLEGQIDQYLGWPVLTIGYGSV